MHCIFNRVSVSCQELYAYSWCASECYISPAFKELSTQCKANMYVGQLKFTALLVNAGRHQGEVLLASKRQGRINTSWTTQDKEQKKSYSCVLFTDWPQLGWVGACGRQRCWNKRPTTQANNILCKAVPIGVALSSDNKREIVQGD